jgi:hypothetical protein
MLQELKTQHREIARLLLEGLRPAQVSEKFGIPIGTVYNIQNDPLFKAHTAKLADEIDKEVVNTRRRLSEMNTKALDVLDDILTYDNIPPSVRLGAAKDVLDRNGYAPAQNINHNHAHFTTDDLLNLKQRAVQAGAVIEAEYETLTQ